MFMWLFGYTKGAPGSLVTFSGTINTDPVPVPGDMLASFSVSYLFSNKFFEWMNKMEKYVILWTEFNSIWYILSL